MSIEPYEDNLIKAAKIIANAIMYLAEQIKNHTYHSTHLHNDRTPFNRNYR
jgi:hypothetical protein